MTATCVKRAAKVADCLNNQNKMYKRRNKILSKFVEKLLKNRILFKGILAFLGLDYSDASLITMYFVVRGISIPKIRSNVQFHHIKISY